MVQPWKQGSTGGCQETGRRGVYCLLSDKQAERSHLCLVCHKKRIGLDMKDFEGEI